MCRTSQLVDDKLYLNVIFFFFIKLADLTTLDEA